MPVEFWDSPDTKVSDSDQQMLTTYAYNKLQDDLSKNFTLVNQPGPDVLTLRVALINATTAVPGLRTVSVIVPQARVLNGIRSLATGSYAFVGSAEGEMKATDSTTGELLAGAVDQRAGGFGPEKCCAFPLGRCGKRDGLLGAEDYQSNPGIAGKSYRRKLTWHFCAAFEEMFGIMKHQEGFSHECEERFGSGWSVLPDGIGLRMRVR